MPPVQALGKDKISQGRTRQLCRKVCPPKRNGKKHKLFPGEPKDAYCLKPILNKAKRAIPHRALSCRFFEPSENPMPILTGKDA